ncbi:MAG: hypothetical protein BWX99_01645 [Deltaproteobacteria bacterium ADurb.Bin151]|nr:MAG: hypothetical protein BWX99_01645 [Deltaproteobacteria bacterium ADurb.Bin151]
MQVFLKHLYDTFGFICSKYTVVYKYAGELTAYGFVQKDCRHRGIHPAGKPQNNFVQAHLLTDLIHSMIDKGFHRPGLPTPANLKQKIGQHSPP